MLKEETKMTPNATKHGLEEPKGYMGELKECERFKTGIYAIVAALVNKQPDTALVLARTVMHGGSVNNSLDLDKYKGKEILND